MKKPLVSIIIAAYNEEKYIDGCLKTLTEQDYPHFEIIIVDDGSTDNTKFKILNFKFKIKFVELSHVGTAIARNTAAQNANGDILVFLDADMEFEKNFISQLVQPIIDKKTKGTFSKLEYVKNWDKPLARCWNRSNIPPLPDKLRVRQDSEIGEDFRAVLKTEFLKVGGFDNTGYTDTWTLGQKLGYKPQNAANAVYYHHNPETLLEVFQSARWIGKRKYKLGKIGTGITVIKTLPVFSVIKGIMKAFKYKEISFILFYLAYDFGILNGAISSLMTSNVSK